MTIKRPTAALLDCSDPTADYKAMSPLGGQVSWFILEQNITVSALLSRFLNVSLSARF